MQSSRRLQATLAFVALSACSEDPIASSPSRPKPPPAIQQVSPTTGSHAGGITLTITGERFSEAVTVEVGGRRAGDMVVTSSTQVTCSLPPSAVTGAVDVTVSHPDRGSSTLEAAFTYTNDAPSVTLDSVTSPQAQHVVLTATVADPDADLVDLGLEVSVDGGAFSQVPGAQIFGTLTSVASSAAGVQHELVWDAQAAFPAQNLASVVLRLTPTDTTDAQAGVSATSNAFALQNNPPVGNTPVRVALLQPDESILEVVLEYVVADPDTSNSISITDMTFTRASDSYSGPLTISGGQGLGACTFSTDGAASTTLWDARADLGPGNDQLVTIQITVNDGTSQSIATSEPFLVHNGPLGEPHTIDAALQAQGLAVGELASERRLLATDVATGTFVEGESLTGGTSGASARIVRVNPQALVVDDENDAFIAGETLTGASSGATVVLIDYEPVARLADVVVTHARDADELGRIAIVTDGFTTRVAVAPHVPGPPISGAANPFLTGYSNPRHVAILDTDGDAFDDLIVANALDLSSGAQVTFAQADAGAGYANVRAHQAVLVARQVGGAVDVTTGTWESMQADRADVAPHARLSGQSSTTYPPAASGDPGMDTFGWFASAIAAADVDGPGSPNAAGRADLVALMRVRQLGPAPVSLPCVVVRPVNAAGQLAAAYYLDPTDLTGVAPGSFAVADVTADAHTTANGGLPTTGSNVANGLPDIIVPGSSDGTLTFYVQTVGTTNPPSWVSTRVSLVSLVQGPALAGINGVAAGDLNGDDVHDLVLLDTAGNRLLVLVHDLESTAPSSLLNLGTPTGLIPLRLAATLDLPESVTAAPVIADFDEDSRLDILVTLPNSGELGLFENTGNGQPPAGASTPTPSFTPAIRFTATAGSSLAAAADFSGDGRQGAVVTGSGDDVLFLEPR